MKSGSARGIHASVPSALSWKIADKKFTRFRTTAVVDESSRKSDIGPAVRFFVFTEQPEPERLVRIEGAPPGAVPATHWTAGDLADRLYLHLFARNPSTKEKKQAAAIVSEGGSSPTAAGVEDLLWALLMSPEFQFVH
jgi:hypothetical protein